MFTPSGRFQPDRKICFSMSDFHPGSVSYWNFIARRIKTLTYDLVYVVEPGMECSNNVRSSFLLYFSLPLYPSPPSSHFREQYTTALFTIPPQLHVDQNEKLTPVFWNRLTGLLSFMLSDEMTTGSITSTDNHKLAFAARSHSWNVAQPRFKEAFPEVSEPIKYLIPSLFLDLFLFSILLD